MKKLAFNFTLAILIILTTGCSSLTSQKENQVIDIAEKKAIEVYGLKQIESEKPLKANLKDGIWTVEGYVPPNTEGGAVEVKISDETLEILSITHYQ